MQGAADLLAHGNRVDDRLLLAHRLQHTLQRMLQREYDDLIDALAHAVRYAQAQGGRAEPPKVVARRESV